MIVIKRASDRGPMIPLEWRTVRHLGLAPEQEVMCSEGHVAFLDRDHAIAEDGTVTPSLDCPEDGCAFHEFVKLEGWVA